MSRVIRVTITALLLGCVVASCGDDDSPPPNVDYVLCAGVGPFEGRIAVFDCNTDSLIDSLGYPGMNTPVEIYGSLSGKYIATTESGRPTRVWDVSTGTQAGMLQTPSQVIFLEEKNLLLAAILDTMRVYALPTFALDTTFWIRLWNPIRLRDTVLAVHLQGSRGWPPDYTQLGVFDVNTLELVDSLRIDAGTGFIHFRWAEPTRDGRMLYLLGADPLGPAAYAYSVRERRITFRTSLYSAFGRIRLSPDQRELWVTDPGPSPVFGPAWPGHILILDASTGAILDTIHTRGLDETSPEIRWRVDNIQFVPDLNKAYVNCSYWGPILVINTESKEITKSLLYDQLRFGASIVVLPRY